MRCWSFGLRLEKRRPASDSAQIVTGQFLEGVAYFSYDELRTATENFSTSNKIGRGGFGIVYKGKLRNGLRVAVKKLAVASKQGRHEFLAEINVIALVAHQNLVRLIGCCVEGTNRILVYEYLENNSLDRALLGQKDTRMRLDWNKRSAICVGTAKGLAFLHEETVPRIVHRDIKASNILLDKSFNAKIGDFGLAKLFPDDITHISTRIAGTMGYLAPEYAVAGQLTMKADVYSFGILVLEIVSGKSSSKADTGGSDKFLLEWAWELYETGSLLELVDTELEEYPEEEALRYMKVALFCTQGAARRRPSMSQVVDMLSRDIKLNEKQLTAPGYFQDSDRPGVGPMPGKKSCRSGYQTSSEPITITHVMPR